MEKLERAYIQRHKASIALYVLSVIFVIPFFLVFCNALAWCTVNLFIFWVGGHWESFISFNDGMTIALVSTSFTFAFFIYASLFKRDALQLKEFTSQTVSKKEYRKYKTRFAIEIACYIIMVVVVVELILFFEKMFGIVLTTENYIVNDIIIFLVPAPLYIWHLVSSVKILSAIKNVLPN